MLVYIWEFIYRVRGKDNVFLRWVHLYVCLGCSLHCRDLMHSFTHVRQSQMDALSHILPHQLRMFV